MILGNSLRSELGGTYARVQCELITDAYLANQETAIDLPTEEEVREYFEERTDLFDQGEKRLVWHLFLRHGQGGSEATEAQLHSIRQRIHEGESFQDLTKEFSHSENRSLGGHLGWMKRGDLPPKLEEIVFALGTDRVSEPQEVAGGGFLVYVSNILPAVRVSFSEAAPRIRQRLAEIEGREFVANLALQDEAAEDDVILVGQALATLFKQASLDREILRVEEATLSLGEFQEAIAALGQEAITIVPLAEQISETYDSLVARLKLCRFARTHELSEERLSLLSEQAIRLATATLVERRLKSRLAQKAEIDPERMQRFFDDNRHHYQGPLRLRVEGLVADDGENPAARLRELEALREELLAGELALVSVAEERPWLQGFEPVWMGPSTLAELEPKVLLYLTQLGSAEMTPVFRLAGKLRLYRVLERQEPTPLDYERVKERVLADFVVRHQQELFEEVLKEMLNEANFVYHEDRVLAHLESLAIRGEPTL